MKQLISKTLLPILILLGSGSTQIAEDLEVEFHGAGWFEFGRVEKSSNPGGAIDYNKNWVQNNGGELKAAAKIDDNWMATFGLGVVQVHLNRGAVTQAKEWYAFWVPYVSDARVSYVNSLFTEEDKVDVTVGSFHYNYNPDSKNMGHYLLQGYVYPGFVVRDFRTLVPGLANTLGAKLGYQSGIFNTDFILKVESDAAPFFDISFANFTKLKIHPAFEFGLGINFHRILPANSDINSPDKACDESINLSIYAKRGQDNACFLFDTTFTYTPNGPTIDTTFTLDTVTGSLSGSKVVLQFRIDPKEFFGGSEVLGKSDLVLYGETAIIGISNRGVALSDIKRRIPFMVGLNFPTFNLFTLSAEIEFYAAKHTMNSLTAQYGSWVPSYSDEFLINGVKDDWKWSVNASKLLFGNTVIVGQVANDHLRLGGTHNDATGREVTVRPKDWYWSMKLAYFF